MELRIFYSAYTSLRVKYNSAELSNVAVTILDVRHSILREVTIFNPLQEPIAKFILQLYNLQSDYECMFYETAISFFCSFCFWCCRFHSCFLT